MALSPHDPIRPGGADTTAPRPPTQPPSVPGRARRPRTGPGRRGAIVALWVGTVTVSTGIGTALGATVFGTTEDNRTVTVAVSETPTAGGSKNPAAPGTQPGAAAPKPPGGSTPAPTITLRCDGGGTGDSDIPSADATNPDKLAAGARDAYRDVEKAMKSAGITLSLRSGPRSYEHQRLLWEAEVACTGSEAEARKRVLPPDQSSHVKGTAIDVAPKAAQTWLEKNGSRYGWCRTYDNEPWHFEYAASHKTGCPARKPHP